MLILEEYEHARRRGARIYAEVVGYGATDDACDIVQPDPAGTGACRSVQRALRRAGVEPDQVDYVNAHGTSTQLNDAAETRAVKAALGARAATVPISSTKSMTGHLLGAAGGVEAIFSILAIRDRYVPPTINLDEPDPECDLDYVPTSGAARGSTWRSARATDSAGTTPASPSPGWRATRPVTGAGWEPSGRRAWPPRRVRGPDLARGARPSRAPSTAS